MNKRIPPLLPVLLILPGCKAQPSAIPLLVDQLASAQGTILTLAGIITVLGVGLVILGSGVASLLRRGRHDA